MTDEIFTLAVKCAKTGNTVLSVRAASQLDRNNVNLSLGDWEQCPICGGKINGKNEFNPFKLGETETAMDNTIK